jgi:hypothetical protein
MDSGVFKKKQFLYLNKNFLQWPLIYFLPKKLRILDLNDVLNSDEKVVNSLYLQVWSRVWLCLFAFVLLIFGSKMF